MTMNPDRPMTDQTHEESRRSCERLVKACETTARQWRGGHPPGHDAILELHRSLKLTVPFLVRSGMNGIDTVATLSGKLQKLQASIRDTCGHDGTCDHCGEIPAVQVPFQLCDACRAKLDPSPTAVAEQGLDDLAHEIAEEDSKALIETHTLTVVGPDGHEWHDTVSVDVGDVGGGWVARAVSYLDAAGILKRCPLDPRLVGWDEDGLEDADAATSAKPLS